MIYLRKAKLFVINGIILTATSFIIRTVGMSFNVYVSNKVGAECTGLFQLILSVYLFAITVATSRNKRSCNKIGYRRNGKKE